MDLSYFFVLDFGKCKKAEGAVVEIVDKCKPEKNISEVGCPTTPVTVTPAETSGEKTRLLSPR